MSSKVVEQTIRTLFEPGAVVELRAFRDRITVSGYFSDHDLLAEEATKLDGKGFGVFATLNEVDPALLARAANRIERYPRATTTDSDILKRRWLPLDFDPVRRSGISSTDREKEDSLARSREVRDYLRKRGWPQPVAGDSGNGTHLLYRVDLPNDRESSELVASVLKALSFRFSDGEVSLDASVANAARIWKLYGTTARKGDDIAERPHRVSRLLSAVGAAAWR